MEGAWVNRDSRTNFYARVINDELVVPYCFEGNDELTSAYYGWKKVGDFWFARFRWLTYRTSGFAFLKHESIDLLVGAWWTNDESAAIPEIPERANLGRGVSARWERIRGAQYPDWALRFFEDVRRHGIEKAITG